MAVDRPIPDRKYTENHRGNSSFDEDLQVNVVEIVGYNPLVPGELERVKSVDGVLQVSGGGGAGSAAYSDSGGTDRKGLVDADRHVQVDVLTMPEVTATVDTTGLATSAKQDTLLAELQLKADLTETQPVSLASVPSHAVTNAGTFAVQAAQSGTWTVQPGNTANTTAWKVDGSAVTQPVSGTVTANIGTAGTLATAAKQDTIIGHVDGIEGLLTTIDADTGTLAGAVSGTEMQVDVITTVPSSDRSTTGNITAAAQSISINCSGLSVIGIDIRGTFSALLVFEGSIDGTNYFFVYADQIDNVDDGGSYQSFQSAYANYSFKCSGFSSFRVRCASYTSGTATVSLRGGSGLPYRLFGVPSPGGSPYSLGVDKIEVVGSNQDQSEWSSFFINTNSGELQIGGGRAHDSIDIGNPLKVGGYASAAAPTAVAAADRVNGWWDLQGRLHTKQSAPTATLSNVNDTASSTTLLSANTSRLGATIVNDSTVVLYVKFGTTASATSYSYKLNPDDTLEVPYGYTGRIDGTWASDASGAARITEYT